MTHLLVSVIDVKDIGRAFVHTNDLGAIPFIVLAELGSHEVTTSRRVGASDRWIGLEILTQLGHQILELSTVIGMLGEESDSGRVLNQWDDLGNDHLLVGDLAFGDGIFFALFGRLLDNLLHIIGPDAFAQLFCTVLGRLQFTEIFGLFGAKVDGCKALLDESNGEVHIVLRPQPANAAGSSFIGRVNVD